MWRRIGGKLPALDWHFGMVSWNNSGAIGWPIELEQWGQKFLVKFQACDKATTFAALSWEGIQAREVHWTSWASQLAFFGPMANKKLLAGIRLVATGGEVPLKTLAAQMGWWNLDCSTLRKLAKGFSMQLQPNLALIDILLVMTTNVLRCSDEEAMNILSKRAAKSTTRDAKSIKILAEVDEATKGLTQEDEEVIRKEQTKTEKSAESDKAFVQAYRVKRQELRKAAAAAAPVKGRGRAPPGSARAKAVTPKWLPECVIGMGQPKANTFMPQVIASSGSQEGTTLGTQGLAIGLCVPALWCAMARRVHSSRSSAMLGSCGA